jgi:hypothetical protein
MKRTGHEMGMTAMHCLVLADPAVRESERETVGQLEVGATQTMSKIRCGG